MPSVHRFVANDRSEVLGATLTASAVRTSTDIRRTSRAAQGLGRFTVTGPYTGHTDTEIEVEVTGTGIEGDAQVSEPHFSGLGSGTLTVTAVDPLADPETLVFTLADAGYPATVAELEFYGVTISAVEAGSAGNELSLTVDRSALEFTPIGFATLSRIAAGTTRLSGPGWDWGQAAATDAGIPAAAMRIAFAGYPQVHRAWKIWEGGAWSYRLSPAPDLDIPAGTRIEEVTGHYTLTLSRPVPQDPPPAPPTPPETEAYAAVTVFDFLSALDAKSDWVTVRGVIAPDRMPGGQSVTDIPLRTDAHALPPIADSRSGRVLTDVAVIDPAAPTEQISVVSVGPGFGGLEIWRVEGTVSGRLANAVSGVLYQDGPVAFRAPTGSAPEMVGARITGVFRPRSRDEGEPEPVLCFKPLVLGSAAINKSVTFTYRPKPPEDCICENMTPLLLSAQCLGIDAQGGPIMALDVEYQTRLEALYEWRSEFMASNVSTKLANERRLISLDPPVLQPKGYDAVDMDYADLITRAFAEALGETYDVKDARDEWDIALTEMQANVAHLEGLTPSDNDRIPNARGEVMYNPYNQRYYKLMEILGDGEPRYCVGLHSGRCDAPSWQEIGRFSGVDFADAMWTTDGTDFVLEFNYGEGSVLWTLTLLDLGTVDSEGNPPEGWVDAQQGDALLQRAWLQIDQLARKYEARMDYVRTLAGLVPKSDASGPAGDGCWRDCPDSTHWWVDESGEYLPICTNQPYVSAARGADGKPMSTREFGLGLVTPCPDRLRAGDQITIRITGAPGVALDADRFTISVIGASAASLSGGAAGDDTHTWTVRGSVSGRLDDWSWSPSDPDEYAGPVTAEMAAGGIPFAVGDRWEVSIEGGTLRWRRDGGAWTDEDIEGPISLGNGLMLVPQRGQTPSFLIGDAWKFRARATYGPGNVRAPVIGSGWAWTGATATLDIDLGAVKSIGAVVLALHTLPSAATITLSGGAAAHGEWTEPVTLRALIYHATSRSARYLRIAIASAGAGASIGWVWAGMPWIPSAGASEVVLRREYALSRGSGPNAAALYGGRGVGGAISWQESSRSWLYPEDMPGLRSLLDHVSAQGMEPLVFVPHALVPEDAALVRVDAESVAVEERYQYQASNRGVYSVRLPLAGVVA